MSFKATGIKRKRKYAGEDYGMGRRGSQVYPTKKRRFVAGRDRVGGYYGRYAGIRGELKFHDVDLDDAVVSNTGTMTATINIIPQGVTEKQRIGRKCTIKSIHWRYRMNIPEVDAAGDPSAGDTVRLILYLDKQANGATAAVLDVLETASMHEFRNLANQGRFTVLMDKTVALNYSGLGSDGAGVVSQAGVTKEFQTYKKCDVPIEFSSTTGAIGEIRSNNLGVLMISRNGLAGFSSKIRLRFSDT